MKKGDFLLIFALLALSFTYFLSFPISKKKEEKRESVKTSLINPKNAEKITGFLLSDSEKQLQINKKQDLWFIEAEENPKLCIPADSQKVEKLLNNLTTVRNMYKISDNLPKGNSFGFSAPSSFTFRYFYNDTFDDIIFGNQDFSLNSRYIMSGRNTKVYEINNEFQTYLSTNSQFWAEAYLISHQILKNNTENSLQRVIFNGKSLKADANTAKIMELRHGGLADFLTANEIISGRKKAEAELKLEFGDKSLVICEFFSVNASDLYWIVKNSYYLSDNKKYTTYSKISDWTYNRIKEITL